MSTPGHGLFGLPHHDGSGLYVSEPAPRPGEEVQLRVLVPGTHPVQRVLLRSVHDGEPRFTAASAVHRTAGATWWQVPVTAHNPVTRYRFLLVGGPADPVRHAWLTASGVHEREVTDAGDFQLVTHDPAPGWVTDAVVYQVFPDRFARSGVERPAPPWAVRRGWDDRVSAHGPDTAREWFGGDLDGVTEHLDHVVDLGATCLYLTPVFEGRSVHRYDAVGFEHVDAWLGGDGALQRLTAAAHRRGLRVVCDLTTNHTGDGHEWFRRAQADPAAPTAAFYRFTEHPGSYVSWLGVPSLPKLFHDSPALREALYAGPGSVVGRWSRPPFSLDGWRIDVANMTGRYGDQDLAGDVARELRRTLAAAGAQTGREQWLLAEHGHDASGDLSGDGWHGTMNYTGFTRPVWTWLTPGEDGPDAHGLPYPGAPVPLPSMDGEQAVGTVREVLASAPWRSWCASTNSLSSHDTPRVRTVVGGGTRGGLPPGGPGAAGRDRHVVALALQATLPGVPAVFAGDEIGLTGTTGEHSRTPFPWHRRGEWDGELLAQYRHWLRLRREHVALRRGGLRWAHVQADSLTFVREHPAGSVLVHAARAAHPRVRVPLAALGGGPARALTGEAVEVDGGALVLPAGGPAAHAWSLPCTAPPWAAPGGLPALR
ncbi:glycoside hydrolase family 13 protein [Kineococcus auxinigenes]|uniref:glycoside hydrolase family 13 protein n=1 Tax=unclassified Kineococcus TaxID=2621656 RepID=UPI003D7C64A8